MPGASWKDKWVRVNAYNFRRWKWKSKIKVWKRLGYQSLKDGVLAGVTWLRT